MGVHMNLCLFVVGNNRFWVRALLMPPAIWLVFKSFFLQQIAIL